MTLIESLLTLAFRTGTHQFGLHGFLASLSSRDLSVCLIDSRQCLLNAGVLELTLAKVILDGSFRSVHRGSCLGNLCLVVVILQFDEEISFVHLLIVRDPYVPDNGGNFGAEGREVAANIGVIGDLLDLAAFPGIPLLGDRNENRYSE